MDSKSKTQPPLNQNHRQLHHRNVAKRPSLQLRFSPKNVHSSLIRRSTLGESILSNIIFNDNRKPIYEIGIAFVELHNNLLRYDPNQLNYCKCYIVTNYGNQWQYVGKTETNKFIRNTIEFATKFHIPYCLDDDTTMRFELFVAETEYNTNCSTIFYNIEQPFARVDCDLNAAVHQSRTYRNLYGSRNGGAMGTLIVYAEPYMYPSSSGTITFDITAIELEKHGKLKHVDIDYYLKIYRQHSTLTEIQRNNRRNSTIEEEDEYDEVINKDHHHQFELVHQTTPIAVDSNNQLTSINFQFPTISLGKCQLIGACDTNRSDRQIKFSIFNAITHENVIEQICNFRQLQANRNIKLQTIRMSQAPLLDRIPSSSISSLEIQTHIIINSSSLVEIDSMTLTPSTTIVEEKIVETQQQPHTTEKAIDGQTQAYLVELLAPTPIDIRQLLLRRRQSTSSSLSSTTTTTGNNRLSIDLSSSTTPVSTSF